MRSNPSTICLLVHPAIDESEVPAIQAWAANEQNIRYMDESWAERIPCVLPLRADHPRYVPGRDTMTTGLFRYWQHCGGREYLMEVTVCDNIIVELDFRPTSVLP